MSQVSQHWSRVGKYVQQSVDDYLITAGKVGGGWSFVVYGPETQIQKKDGRLYFQGMIYKTQYQKGEPVPPMFNYDNNKARQLIGAYKQLDQAKQAYQNHKEEQCQQLSK